ncbi:hypothetical protein DFJ73DRAFT_872774 [Zopfochytrium polystomum]|nr:hypothetical protein DFJ73DRAFT_872774 [Zopfochytrium polystomum]
MTGHRRISASREALVDALLASLSHLVSSPLSFPLSSPPLSPPSSSSLTSSSHLLPTLSLPTLSSSSRSSASSPVTPTSPQSSPTSPPSLNSLQNRLCVQQQHEPQPQIQKPVDEQDHSSYQQALWPVSPCPDASTLPPTSTIFVPSTPTSPNRGQVNAATTPTAPVFASCEVPLTATGGTSNTRSPSSRPRPGRLYSRARRPAPYTPAPRRVVDQLYREAFVFVPSARSPPLVAEATSRAYRQKRMEGPARPVEDIRRWDMVADDTLDSEKRMFARKAVSLAIAKEIARLAEEQMCPPTDVVVDPPLRWDPHTVLQQSPPPSPSKLSASEEGAESDEADEVAQVPTSTGPIYMRPLRMNRHQAFLFIDLHNRWTAPGFMADYQKMARRRSAPMPSPGATSTPALPATPFAKATFVLPPNRVMVSAAAIAGGMEFVGAPKTSSLTNYARDGCGPTAGPSGTSSVASGTLSDAAFRSSETASGTAMDPFTVARTGFATDSGTSGTACGTASGPSSAAQIPSLWKGKDREVPQARPTYVPDYGDYIFDDDLDVEIAAFPTPENEEYDVEGNH